MNELVLGISAFYHDSAAALVRGGNIIAAAQEERFTRKKHDSSFPVEAINYCLEEAFVETNELDAIVFYDNPFLSWDRALKSCMMARDPQKIFPKIANSMLGEKVWVEDYALSAMGSLGKMNKLLFAEHHISHAASAFYPSPFTESAFITLDGVGEWATTTTGFGDKNTLQFVSQIDYPHSLGLLYSAFTYYCGFKVNSGEYKLMGLAPYGEAKYKSLIYDHLIDVKADGSYRLNTEYFGYINDFVMTSDKFNKLFGGEPRKPESLITRKEMDLAASIQKVIEEIVLLIAKYTKKETGSSNLVMAGGVALNCVANGRLLREKIFDKIWIQPAAGDAGGALGAALSVTYNYFENDRVVSTTGDSQHGSYLGPAYSRNEIKAFLDFHDYPYTEVSCATEKAKKIAKAIYEEKIIGYFCGRMEFGPRALGARSILGNPLSKTTQSVMNQKIKFRESFRPFAPSVNLDKVSDFFEMECSSPYMLLVAFVKKERQLPVDTDTDDLIKIVNLARSDIPAITHVDYSARIQTVTEESKADYYQIIKEFGNLSGYEMVVNTSFNVRSEPIVCSPRDAYTCFMRTEMDLLVLENFLLWKKEQPNFDETEDWKKNYELD
ncbi:carbamoyltransferase family protein [Candidatus Uabimicrobium amorphum]|uniref:Carbamoyltransferase n=1 Tax=Uabimicrobium amorphum TaxID=2596890 RepID=A0A5S9IH23_UABAM|nr:carbamoyltransferase [Candidatus Uabimicrobium amorphum]BBM81679.1 carbamoyltransferase [Candidatus Uabimicrobium amorphum]